MLNQSVLVGRVVKDIEYKKIEDKDVCQLCLAVPRNIKNINGDYGTDFIDCILFQSVAQVANEYCKKGDFLGIRGRLESSLKNINGVEVKTVQLIAEKISFLSSNKPA